MRHTARNATGAMIAVLLAGLGPSVDARTTAAGHAGAAGAIAADSSIREVPEWAWPLAAARLVRPFTAPAHAYGPGHRGVDLTGVGAVRAPADGVVAFRGTVGDRGVVTIDHGAGLVSTLEPVREAPPPGTVVSRGEGLAALDTGGHAEPGTLHLGVRRHGAYINPLLLLGGLSRAVLLPCC